MSRLGRAVYYTVHQPRNFFLTLGRENGFPQTFINRWNGALMLRAARSLPPAAPANPSAKVRVCYLTGRRFWHLTAFTHASLAKVAPHLAMPVFLSDGSLDESLARRLTELFPGAEIIDEAEIRESVERHLPAFSYPNLRRLREELPIARKLLDLHAGKSGWKLYLDSDALFFRKPEFLESWADSPGNLYLSDVASSYAYSDKLLASLLGQPILPRVNAGMIGLCSEKIDFEKLEYWTSWFYRDRPVSWLTEQCLTAMLMTLQGGTSAPSSDYIVSPTQTEAQSPKAVFHHYCGGSRRFLYSNGWKNVLKLLSS